MADPIVVAKVAGYDFKAAGIVRNAARNRWSADKTLADAVAEETETDILGVMEDLRRLFAQLKSNGKEPDVATVGMVFEAFAKARVQAESN